MNKFYKRKIAFMLLLAMAAGNNTLAMQKSKPQISELGFKRELNSPKSLNTGAKVGILLSTSLLLGSLTSFAIWKIMFNNDKVKNLQIKNRDDQLNNLDVQQVEEYNDDKFNDSIEEENNQRDDELLNKSKVGVVNEVNEIKELSHKEDLNISFQKLSELDILKIKLKSLGSKKHYDIGANGKNNINNPILDIDLEQVMATGNFNNSKIFGLARLYDLCYRYGITKGMPTGDENHGWDIPAYDYFFVNRGNDASYSCMYDRLSNYHKALLLKCIEFMYNNDKNDDSADWKKAAKECLVTMSLHGAHCPWRAEAIVNTVYSKLVKFLFDKGKILGNDLDGAFCELKEKLVGNVHDDYIKNNPDDGEPLDDINKIVKGMKYKFGMPGGDRIYEGYAGDYFKNAMKADNLIKLSHEILNKLEQEERDSLMFNDESPISFEEYCEYTMKTPAQIEEMLDKIWSYNTDEAKELKSWIQHKKELSLGYVFYNVSVVFGYEDESVYDLTKYYFGLKFLINLVKKDYLFLLDNDGYQVNGDY
jgi:hypothetical protein